MKLVILAGGYGSRLGNLTNTIPKPMIQVGGRPMLWHIMKIYSYYGINEFIICLGYRGDVIKDYFMHYESQNSDFTVDLKEKSIVYHSNHCEDDWKVTVVDTGLDTLKGARLKRIESFLIDEINLLTYGDGVADINILDTIEFHKRSGKIVTLSGVHPPARFGELTSDGDVLTAFEEKAQASQGMINGGYMVFNRSLLDYLSPEPSCDLEIGVLDKLAKEGKVAVFKHEGLWACVDHERDLNYLENLWRKDKAFWKIWDK